MAGVALIMIVDQLPRLTGVPVHGSHFFPQLASFISHIPQVDPATLVFGAAALGFLLAVQHFLPKLPGPLLVVVLGAAAVSVFALDQHGIKVIGTVPSGLPHASLPDPGDLPRLLLPALGVLLVGYTDVILTARAFAVRAEHSPAPDRDPVPDRELLDPNQELLALGAANPGSGVLQGFPVSSSASRTAIADSAGARSQAYSLVAFGGVPAVLLFLSPLLARIPAAVPAQARRTAPRHAPGSPRGDPLTEGVASAADHR